MGKRIERPMVGRPPTYKKEYCAIAEQKASDGYSVPVIARYCGEVDRQTIHDWAVKHKEFSHALRRGRSKRLERLEFMLTCHQMGRKTKDFDPKQSSLSAIMFELKCRYHEDWSDKQKIIEIVTDFVAKTGNQKLDILSICSEVKKD